MPLLFSYGTLQRPDVQLATFGRLLQGAPDALSGCELGQVKIDDPSEASTLERTHYDNVVFDGSANSQVTGTVLEVTDAELEAADRYEEPASYQRSLVVLASGTQAWVYAYNPSIRPLP